MCRGKEIEHRDPGMGGSDKTLLRKLLFFPLNSLTIVT